MERGKMNTILKMALLFSIALDFVILIAVNELWIRLFALIALILIAVAFKDEMKRR
jgi:hypothetical protein